MSIHIYFEIYQKKKHIYFEVSIIFGDYSLTNNPSSPLPRIPDDSTEVTTNTKLMLESLKYTQLIISN